MYDIIDDIELGTATQYNQQNIIMQVRVCVWGVPVSEHWLTQTPAGN